MFKSTASVLAFAFMTTSCASVADTPQTNDCVASDYEASIGANIAAITLPAGLDHRIIGPDEAYTQDYIPSRLNIFTDEEGSVVRVTCG